VSRTGQYRVGYDEGAPLPLFLLDRVTIERLKPGRDQVAAATRR
jgi:hypothetical protein